MAKRKQKQKNEFRYNRNTKHMNYIFAENDKYYIGMGLTTEEYTFGIKNMPLRKNLQRNHEEESYIRNGIITSKKQNYAHADKRFEIVNEDDKACIKAKKRNYRKINKKR